MMMPHFDGDKHNSASECRSIAYLMKIYEYGRKYELKCNEKVGRAALPLPEVCEEK